MALFLITIKQNKYSNGINLEKGMSVEVSSNYSNPLSTNGGHEVQDALMRKCGITIQTTDTPKNYSSCVNRGIHKWINF